MHHTRKEGGASLTLHSNYTIHTVQHRAHSGMTNHSTIAPLSTVKTFSLVETERNPERNPDASFRPLLAAAHLFDISLHRFFDAEAVMWAVGATALVSLALTLFAMQTKVRTRHAL